MKTVTNKRAKRYNLKFWRMSQGLTQAQIAQQLRISTGHYKAIENGVYNPSLKIINRFCDTFDLGNSDVEIAHNLQILFGLKKEENEIKK